MIRRVETLVEPWLRSATDAPSSLRVVGFDADWSDAEQVTLERYGSSTRETLTLRGTSQIVIQLSHSLERSRAGWWARLRGQADRVVTWLHVEIRVDGRHRIRLSAQGDERWRETAECAFHDSVEVDDVSLRNLIAAAVHLGATWTRGTIADHRARARLETDEPVDGEITEPAALNPVAVRRGDQLRSFRVGRLYGFELGEEVVIPARYTDVDGFSEGLAPVALNGVWGFIDPWGSMVIEPRYSAAFPFRNGFAEVIHRGHSSQIPRPAVGGEREHRPAPVNETAAALGEKLVAVNEGRLWGYRRGSEMAIPPAFDDCDRFSEGLAAVRKGDRWGYIDPWGRLVVPMMYDAALSFENGYARVVRSGESSLLPRPAIGPPNGQGERGPSARSQHRTEETV